MRAVLTTVYAASLLLGTFCPMQWTMSMFGMEPVPHAHAADMADVLHIERPSHCIGGPCVMNDVNAPAPVAAGIALAIAVAAFFFTRIRPATSACTFLIREPYGPPGRNIIPDTTVLLE